MWSDEQRRSILDYHLQKISSEALLVALSLAPEDVLGEVRQQLSEAIEARDLDLVDDAVGVAWIFNIETRSYLDLVARIFGGDWHRHHVHEGLVWELQQMADPSTVPILRDAIALKPKIGWENDYVESRSFFQRCSHALREIDTPESLALIEECSWSHNAPLRDEMLYRLLRIASGEEKPLATAGEGAAARASGAVEPGTGKSLGDLVYDASETCGVENLRLVHALIVEACRLYSAHCGYDVYSDILALVEAPDASFADIVERERWFLRLYLFLSVNVRRPVRSLGYRDNLEDTPPYEICDMLRHDGAERSEVYDIFGRAIANVEKNALPSVYRQNAHVLKEGYVIGDAMQ